MKVVGLTGGIGSGKTTVAKMFAAFGIPVYIADDEAKKIMQTDSEVQQQIKKLLGEKAFDANGLNKKYIASKVFRDKMLLEQLNQIVHPAVGRHFQQWLQQQKGAYAIKEAAVLFENGAYKSCDKTILVTAPEAIRIERVVKRDKTTEAAVRERINNQWPESKKEALADVTIHNAGSLEDTSKKVRQLHADLLKEFNNKQ